MGRAASLPHQCIDADGWRLPANFLRVCFAVLYIMSFQPAMKSRLSVVYNRRRLCISTLLPVCAISIRNHQQQNDGRRCLPHDEPTISPRSMQFSTGCSVGISVSHLHVEVVRYEVPCYTDYASSLGHVSLAIQPYQATAMIVY